ncbi:MAG TPA: hypothetical protein VGG82_07730 [Casimicrobiaceae bacterium]|jgi:hypothetical protein
MSEHNGSVEAFSVADDYDRLRGRLFEFFEALGLPSRQEQAVKRMVRSITYESQASVEAALRRERSHAR